MPLSRPFRLTIFATFMAAASGALAQQGAVGLTDTSERLQARSDIKGLVFTMLDRLPRPTGSRLPEFCRHYAATPNSDGAKAALAQGWTVTGEAPLGAFTAVSFAGKFEAATSGTCFVADGNVGIFKGSQLVALAYVQRGAKQLSIGRVAPLEGGGVRVWDGEPGGTPFADIRTENAGYLLRLGALAPRETFCRGRAIVPNIYGMPIDKARQSLIQSGWTPVPSTPDAANERFGREADFRKRGISEIESCSGTGFGYCGFVYKGAAGGLSVTTIGEGEGDALPRVSGYDTSCS